MRRGFVVLVLMMMVCGVLAMTTTASAGPPVSETIDRYVVECAFEAEFGFVELHAGVEDFGGEEGPFEWVDVVVFSDEDFLFPFDYDHLSFGEGSFAAELTLFSEMAGDVAGSAEVMGAYEQVGDLELVEEGRSKFANRVEDLRRSEAPLAVTGEMTVGVDGFAPEMFDLAECEGRHEVEERWSTNPTAFVQKASGMVLDCNYLESEGWVASLFAIDEDRQFAELFLDVWAPGSEPFFDPPTYYGFLDSPDLGYGSLTLTVDLWEPWSEDPVDVALVDATLTEGQLEEVFIVWQTGYQKVEVHEVLVEGTLAIPEVTFDMGACFGEAWDVDVFDNPILPNGKGKAPGNDLPEDAEPLVLRDSAQTRMALEEPEAGCEDPMFGEIPLGKTVWYTVEGTGAPVTVDTTGSDFDTVIGIYTMEGDALAQHACLDDVFDDTGYTNIATITFDTAEFVTYFVQIGGFDGQYGHLKVSVD